MYSNCLFRCLLLFLLFLLLFLLLLLVCLRRLCTLCRLFVFHGHSSRRQITDLQSSELLHLLDFTAFSLECGMSHFVAELFCDNDLPSKGSAYSSRLIWMTTWNHSLLSILVAKEDLAESLIVSLSHQERPIANFNFGNRYTVVKILISLPLSSFKSIFIFSTSVSGN